MGLSFCKPYLNWAYPSYAWPTWTQIPHAQSRQTRRFELPQYAIWRTAFGMDWRRMRRLCRLSDGDTNPRHQIHVRPQFPRSRHPRWGAIEIPKKWAPGRLFHDVGVTTIGVSKNIPPLRHPRTWSEGLWSIREMDPRVTPEDDGLKEGRERAVKNNNPHYSREIF